MTPTLREAVETLRDEIAEYARSAEMSRSNKERGRASGYRFVIERLNAALARPESPDPMPQCRAQLVEGGYASCDCGYQSTGVCARREPDAP